MATIYTIRYKFLDEIGEKGWRDSLVCVYEQGTPSGDNLQHALDVANDEDDWSGVDKLLTAMFKLKDDDIAFYYDTSDLEDGATNRALALVVELQKSNDILIDDIRCIDVYE